jgi:hypothetical protein
MTRFENVGVFIQEKVWLANILSLGSGYFRAKPTRFENVGVFIREKVWLENSLSPGFLLGNSPASEFYMATFRNTLTLPSS